METETPQGNTLTASSHESGPVEFELATISPSVSTKNVDGCKPMTPNVILVNSPLLGNNTNSSEAENKGPNDKEEEEIKPLALSASNVETCDLISSSVPKVPKNRRRPGSSSDGTKVMMTGIVRQGSGGGSPVEVEVELSGRELERLTSRESCKQNKESCPCGIFHGPHIVLLSLVCIPVAFIISLCLSFFNGSITWYNLFIYFSEEKSIVHRLTLCPLLVLSFPITVGLSTLLLSIVASFMQISWSWMRWKTEILDGEKGFFGWLCHKMNLPDCSPYQVVILEDSNIVF